MIEPVFVIPVGAGMGTAVVSFALFKRNSINPRYFAIALLVSVALIISPLIFYALDAIKQLFGIQFTFVLGFGIANIVTLSLVVYLLLIIGKLRNEITTLWQEIALMESELEESEGR